MMLLQGVAMACIKQYVCMYGWMDSLVSMEEIQVLNDTEGEEEKS